LTNDFPIKYAWAAPPPTKTQHGVTLLDEAYLSVHGDRHDVAGVAVNGRDAEHDPRVLHTTGQPLVNIRPSQLTTSVPKHLLITISWDQSANLFFLFIFISKNEKNPSL
jgi:hypothetical protein